MSLVDIGSFDQHQLFHFRSWYPIPLMERPLYQPITKPQPMTTPQPFALTLPCGMKCGHSRAMSQDATVTVTVTVTVTEPNSAVSPCVTLTANRPPSPPGSTLTWNKQKQTSHTNTNKRHTPMFVSKHKETSHTCVRLLLV